MAYLLYDGPSMLDGKPIVAVATGVEKPSQNRKTGPLIQTYIIRKDIDPVQAVLTGEDYSICGTCPLRGDGSGKKRACYVVYANDPLAVYNSRDKWKVPDYDIFRGRGTRLGAYGDPAALPTEVVADIVRRSRTAKGYTHQWRYCDQELRKYMMASCDSAEDVELARQKGWSTLRVRAEGQEKLKGEIQCPYEISSQRVLCSACNKCTGNKSKDVVVTVHGTGKKHFPLRQEAA